MVERSKFYYWFQSNILVHLYRFRYHFYRLFTTKRVCWVCATLCKQGEYFVSDGNWWGEKFPIYECEGCACK